MTNNNNLFKGRWKIVWMEQWDQEYVNLCKGGHITIDEKGNGEFQFGTVDGSFQIALGQAYFNMVAMKWTKPLATSARSCIECIRLNV
jgi:hypothetical protein